MPITLFSFLLINGIKFTNLVLESLDILTTKFHDNFYRDSLVSIFSIRKYDNIAKLDFLAFFRHKVEIQWFLCLIE